MFDFDKNTKVQIRPYHPAWFEEPVHSHDMNAIKALKDREIGMKLGYGESMRNYYAFETYAEKGADHLMPLVGRMSAMYDLINRLLCWKIQVQPEGGILFYVLFYAL